VYNAANPFFPPEPHGTHQHRWNRPQPRSQHLHRHSFLGTGSGSSRRVAAAEIHSLIVFTETHASLFGDRFFLQRHHRLAIRFLVARVQQRVERERVILRRGDLFLDKCAEQRASISGSCRAMPK